MGLEDVLGEVWRLVVHFVKDHVGVLLLLLLPLNDSLWGCNVIMQLAIDLRKQLPDLAPQLLQLAIHFLIPIKRTIGTSYQYNIGSQP